MEQEIELLRGYEIADKARALICEELGAKEGDGVDMKEVMFIICVLINSMYKSIKFESGDKTAKGIMETIKEMIDKTMSGEI